MQQLYLKVAQGLRAIPLQSDIAYLRQRFPKIDNVLKLYDGVQEKEGAMLRALLEICFQAKGAPEVFIALMPQRARKRGHLFMAIPSTPVLFCPTRT
ncbi:hypothetical protein [Helicobacter felis]|uniref:hypothetical protein n=1 Tax=Helicobacter felis TaxID=214 RepID=UPI000CF1C218|nr:hypothetical protein [Helicobacter felis]